MKFQLVMRRQNACGLNCNYSGFVVVQPMNSASTWPASPHPWASTTKEETRGKTDKLVRQRKIAGLRTKRGKKENERKIKLSAPGERADDLLHTPPISFATGINKGVIGIVSRGHRMRLSLQCLVRKGQGKRPQEVRHLKIAFLTCTPRKLRGTYSED